VALLPVDAVIDELLAGVQVIKDTELVGLGQVCGRYLSADITSPVNVPPAANSAMDGYAVRRSEIVNGQSYEISDRIPAGSVGNPLRAGTVARIFTGAEIPANADAVVIQEDTQVIDGVVVINTDVEPGQNIRPLGQDIGLGKIILERGRRVKSRDIGLIASVGKAQVEVYRPLTIGIMSTGDELIEPPGPLAPGQIFNSNQYALIELIKSLGMSVVDLGIVADTPEATRAALRKGADLSDCILSTGGVSVGEEDHVRAAVESLGNLDIWRLAIKPGKPLAFGQVEGTPFFGLPGNPVSMFVTFMIVARPYLKALQGGSDVRTKYLIGEADFELAGGSRREYMRVQTEVVGDTVRLSKFPQHGSGIMSSVSWANALVEIEIGQQVRRGDKLRYCSL
jgi:molybdopterin molybdotransferase